MPVDFTTLRLREYDASKILNNMTLDFPPNVDNKTGVIFTSLWLMPLTGYSYNMIENSLTYNNFRIPS